MNLYPPRWSDDEIVLGAAQGLENFRAERLNEAREDYVSHFEDSLDAVESLLEETVDLLKIPTDTDLLSAFLEPLRYIAAPPVSEDDLESLSGVAKRNLARSEYCIPVLDTIFGLVDGQRFPWLAEHRHPSEQERRTAAVSTAALIAAQRIATARRNEAKRTQEMRVALALLEAGFEEVKPRVIRTLRAAPAPGQFCGESVLGTRKADMVVGLLDDRVLAIECKVSNSRINSVKRINNDAAVKSRQWIEQFGTQAIVPAAVIAGVYHPPNLMSAQDDGLTIWWSHDLGHMIDWVLSAR